MERITQLSPEQQHELRAALLGMKLVTPMESFAVDNFSGGVSCDVWLISKSDGNRFVVKQALSKLRVLADWRAPRARSGAEVAWLRLVGGIDPALAPRVLADDGDRHIFAMQYLAPDSHSLWKRELALGRIEPGFAVTVGAALARIHAATAGRNDIAAQFANQAQFHALRLEPYLLYTAEKHADLSAQLHALAEDISSARIALMQGDVSPKNILRGPNGPVFLDAETACYGDPAFDLAFCLNHLLLKCIWHPEHQSSYLVCFDALAAAYRAGIAWESPETLECRASTLLPALMLARIDGKSPVEYITSDVDKDFVRHFARKQVAAPYSSLNAFSDAWSDVLACRLDDLERR